MLVDLHIQTPETKSCKVSFEATVRAAMSSGLDAIAVVDRMASSRAANWIEVGRSKDLPVFIGVEVPTDHGHLLCFHPEVDPFFTAEKWRLLTEFGLPDAKRVIQFFDSEGGAVLAGCPYDSTYPYPMNDRIFMLWGLHGVEVHSSNLSESLHEFALETAYAIDTPTGAGSIPRRSEKEIGKVATLFAENAVDQAMFVHLLRGSDYWAVDLTKLAGREQPQRRRGPRDHSGPKPGGRSGPRLGRSGPPNKRRGGPSRSQGRNRRGPPRQGGRDRGK